MSSPTKLERPCRPPLALIKFALLFGILTITICVPTVCAGSDNWIATWATAPTAAAPLESGFAPPYLDGFTNQSIRNIIHTSLGGAALRVRLTNAFGSQPITFHSVYVGLAQTGASVVPGSNHPLTFQGSLTVTIPVGGDAVSDPLSFQVPRNANLAITLFTADATGTPTVHLSARQTTYVADGNFAASEGGDAFVSAATTWYFIASVDVLTSPRVKGAVVAFGDSVTDSDGSTLDANHRWPDYLASRFLSGPPGLELSVVNEGISANRALTDSPCFGLSAIDRVDVDVLSRTGARFVIFMEGLNDIGFPTYPYPYVCFGTNVEPSDAELIAGYEKIADKVHAKGMKIFIGTLTPFKGIWYWTPDGEAKRARINNLIKSSTKFDGVVDFAAVLADPTDPTMLAPQFNSGDNIHPNDAGNKAMADAIDLSIFLPRR